MEQDLDKKIDELLARAYQEEKADVDYQNEFADEGSRKAQYIVDNLRYREAKKQLSLNNMGYLCIGGADGSEVLQVLSDTEIPKAVMIEISDSAVQRAVSRVKELSLQGKEFVVMHGDATALLDESLQKLEAWCSAGEISGLVCSAQGVLHELTRRSPGFDLPIFLGKLFRNSGWQMCAFYSREPCVPAGWPDNVRIRIPELGGEQLARFAQYVRDRLRMSGSPEVLASDWVALPSMLAVETLHKLIRGGSIRRIGYELGEQLTEFDPMAVKNHLESCVDDMKVSVELICTGGLKTALQDYEVEYIGHDSQPLSLPRSHSEIVGIRPLGPGAGTKMLDEEQAQKIHSGSKESVLDLKFSNPFGGDISDESIRRWLSQFEPEEQTLVSRLLDGFTYIGLDKMKELTVKLHMLAQNRQKDTLEDAWFLPLGGVAKSGGMISYFYRVENGIPDSRFLDHSQLAEHAQLEDQTFVLIDDLLASGHQALIEWNKIRGLAKFSPSCRFLLATLVSCEAGEQYINERTNLDTCSVIKLAHADEPIDSATSLFPTKEEREQLRNVLKKYGDVLSPRSPFGYSGSALLLGFAHSIPDNSLPIFWSKTGGWIPLLKSGGSGRTFVQ